MRLCPSPSLSVSQISHSRVEFLAPGFSCAPSCQSALFGRRQHRPERLLHRMEAQAAHTCRQICNFSTKQVLKLHTTAELRRFSSGFLFFSEITTKKHAANSPQIVGQHRVVTPGVKLLPVEGHISFRVPPAALSASCSTDGRLAENRKFQQRGVVLGSPEAPYGRKSLLLGT